MTISSIPIITKKINLIGVCGKAGSGKDTVGSYLSARYADTWVDWFAWPLKQAACDAFGIPEEHFNDRSLKEEINPFWGVSPRKIAQFMGTEMFRDTVSKLIEGIASDFWVRRFAGKVNGDLDISGVDYRDGETIVICDVRFQNEVDFIEANGGIIIRLLRDLSVQEIKPPDHTSEHLSTLTFNERTFSIDNTGTFEDLYFSLNHFMQHNFPQVGFRSANGLNI